MKYWRFYGQDEEQQTGEQTLKTGMLSHLLRDARLRWNLSCPDSHPTLLLQHCQPSFSISKILFKIQLCTLPVESHPMHLVYKDVVIPRTKS
jgi:hypothetical protein